MDDYERLVALLERARRRAEASNPFSPEWDAATDEIEELERRIRALRQDAQAIPLTA